MIVIVFIAWIFLRFGLGISIFHLFLSLPYHIKDFISYVRYKGWKEFRQFGLDLYVGSFGMGKTLYAANRVISLHKRYPNVPVYSNIRLKGIRYIPLRDFNQIVDINGKAIVLCDEMGVMFNSRNYGSFPMALLDNILQCRHLGLLIIGTAQKYEDVDTIIRKNISRVIELKKLTSRLIGYNVYDGYKCWYSNVDFHNIRPDSRSVFMCISDKMRSCYDTKELAANITDVIDDDSYDKRHMHESKLVSRYKKKYSGKRYSTGGV